MVTEKGKLFYECYLDALREVYHCEADHWEDLTEEDQESYSVAADKFEERRAQGGGEE